MPPILPSEIHGWAAPKAGAPLEKITVPLGPLSPFEILLEVKYCGVCHSDLHLIHNDWKISSYPLIPGHEIIGRVVGLGNSVHSLHVGDTVGVGWQRTACLECEDCVSGWENLCPSLEATCVGHAGGYADYHRTDARFCFKMPSESDGPAYAPLFCGGATVFNPLTAALAGSYARTARVGVIGLGGLGHLAVKIARAMGYEVTLFSSTPEKKKEAEALGVHHFVASNEAESISATDRRLDLVLVTANVDLPWAPYLKTLRSNGALCFVGIPPSPLSISPVELMNRQLRVTASNIASRHQIEAMLEFCVRNEIGATAETYPIEKVNEVLPRVRANRVRYRAVLEIGR
jgi:alcohol/geraniol dehydrogenase (NADP+)